MNSLRHAMFLALALGASILARAAESTGPAADEIIYPRRGETAAAAPAPAASSPSASAGAFAPAGGPSTGGALTAFGYVAALGVLATAGWFLFKRGGLPRPFSKGDGRLQVLETRLLGNRQFLVVVEYDDARMLLGVCPGRIDYLTPLTGHPLAAAGAAEESEAAPPDVAGLRFSVRQ